ncbi:D-lyxose/D-mannose family sugar isomerase [Evansella tamaricis]|uniref:D-lyxose/D-mannose family sugar isomerase n=1 Tax=Evansella tamaricis TaxID=2069301 RepID=A0ABS6JE71_9BACI|nr:D-lyxose/D-mannose family sugar isomerase [Evansella tamaricis]MBU9711972.1 D-lyxose/D-mannose family sugar isomerase [Evansella tamaricis]
MKRSEINNLMRDAIEFIEKMNFKLPPFAYWNAKEWETKGRDYDEIRDNYLGWDITDFGSGDFKKKGLLLFTIRNGNLNNDNYIKSYAEKLLIVEEEQITPLHFHWNKMEDIINRGGGNLCVQLYNSTEEEGLADTPVQVSVDGRILTVPAGGVVTLTPGESITLPVGMYHKFWGEKGTGKVLVGEVSMVNDDFTDNKFYEEVGRFAEIEEDEEPLYLLGNEYRAGK